MNPHLADLTLRASATADLAVLRADFDDHAGRSLALPVAGTVVWSAIGVAALTLPPATASLVLLFGTGAIFPLGLSVAHLLGERLIDNPSPLAALMGRCVLMVTTRAVLVTAAWWLIPAHRISAVATAVLATYCSAICALATRPRGQQIA